MPRTYWMPTKVGFRSRTRESLFIWPWRSSTQVQAKHAADISTCNADESDLNRFTNKSRCRRRRRPRSGSDQQAGVIKALTTPFVVVS